MGRETHTPIRAVRVPDDVWNAAKQRAAAEGTDVSAVVRHALRRYGDGATANVMPPPHGQRQRP
jgi:hypothetical protein